MQMYHSSPWYEVVVDEAYDDELNYYKTNSNRESAKEQLLKIVDKQRLRKTVGNFVPKNETEQYIDEIIQHVS